MTNPMALNKPKALKALVKELEKNYLLQRACSKLGLTRSTVYRWMQEDPEFAAEVRAAQGIGSRFMSDYVESKLLKNVEDQHERAIEFWLKSNNERYRTHEKALQRQIDVLKDKLRESQTALSVYPNEELFNYIDMQKLNNYVGSAEWDEGMQLLERIAQGGTPQEQEVLRQVKLVLKQTALAKNALKSEFLPDENDDLVD